jgi:DNA modification methylase
MPTSQIRQAAVGMLRAHPANAHAHSKKQIAKIARSIRQFGFTVPIIVDENNVILAGHGRWLAAQHLGLELVPVVVLSGLSDAGRMEELRAHPSAKPVALVADAIKDCTRRGDVVLDTFSGSGTTIMAAERVGRHARALEIEPRFVDVAIHRWQAFTRRDARHAESGLSFDEIAADRSQSGRFASK